MPIKELTTELRELFAKAGSSDRLTHEKYAEEFAKAIQDNLRGEGVAKALEMPLRQGRLPGPIVEGIFQQIPLVGTSSLEMPLHFITPGTESEFVAYTVPNQGRIPAPTYEGDYVMIPTYRVAAGAATTLKYVRDANYMVINDLEKALYSSFVKKMNDDCFHVILAAGADRNVVVYDTAASNGQFTKRSLSLGKLVMRRNGGGNTGTVGRNRLTDVYLSPEATEDIRNWGVDQLDEVSRREIYTADDNSGAVTRIYGVNLHEIDELGDGQEYQLYYEDTLSGTMPSGDVEIAVGLDLTAGNNHFVMPLKEPVQIFNDPTAHRSGLFELYGHAEYGVANLDNRSVILLSM